MTTDDDLCPFSELSKDTCGDACCRPDLTQRRTMPTTSGPTQVLTARFAGKCADCREDIVPGDTIHRTNHGDYVCEDCA